MNDEPAHAADLMMTLEEEEIAVMLGARVRRGDMQAVARLAELRQRQARRALVVDAPQSMAAISEISGRLLRAAARGEISPAEAAHMSVILENHGKALERKEIERRIATMEARLHAQRERPA